MSRPSGTFSVLQPPHQRLFKETASQPLFTPAKDSDLQCRHEAGTSPHRLGCRHSRVIVGVDNPGALARGRPASWLARVDVQQADYPGDN